MNTDEKITQLETALAHQDNQIHELNEIVTKQWQQIDRLNRRLDQMMAKLEEAAATAENAAPQSVSEEAAANKPPHY